MLREAFLIIFAVTLTGSVPVANLCYIVRPGIDPTQPFLVTHFSVNLYRSIFSNYNWEVIPIAINLNAEIRNAVEAMVLYGQQCDALLGPGYSSYSVALSPVVNIPWMDYASTSIELSDKSVYPWFTRDIPTDSQIGDSMANVMRYFNWDTVNVLSSDDSYGTSVSQELIANFVQGGGVVAISQSLDTSATVADVTSALNLVTKTGKSRIIAVGMPGGSVLFNSLINATLELGLLNDYVFFFSESACSDQTQWNMLPGALCVTFELQKSIVNTFLAAYDVRNLTGEIEALASYGWTQPIESFANGFNVYTAFAHDAVLHMMHSLNDVPNITNASDGLSLLLSTVTYGGMTGNISLDSNGNRLGTTMLLVNIGPDGGQVGVGTIVNSNVGRYFNHTEEAFASVYWLNSYYSDVPPPATIASVFQLQLWMIILAAVCVTVILLFILLVGLIRRNPSAFRKFLGVGLLSHVVNSTISVAVLVVKILVGVNLYYSSATGYVVSYYVIMVIGIFAMLWDVYNRIRYVVSSMATEDGLPFEDEARWQASISMGDFATALLSDAPSVAIASFLISTGSTIEAIGLIIALAVVSAFVCGIKMYDVPVVLSHVFGPTGTRSLESSGAASIQENAPEFTELVRNVTSKFEASMRFNASREDEFANLIPMNTINAPNPLGAADENPNDAIEERTHSIAAGLAEIHVFSPIGHDETTEAKHLARLHAVALQNARFKKRTIIRVYMAELLACFKLRAEHLLVLIPGLTNAAPEHSDGTSDEERLSRQPSSARVVANPVEHANPTPQEHHSAKFDINESPHREPSPCAQLNCDTEFGASTRN